MAGSLLDPDGYYALFGVGPSASPAEIKRAHRRLLKLWHPDKNSSDSASEMTQKITMAWLVIGDPQQRREYDARARRSAGYTHEPPPYSDASPASAAPAPAESFLPAIYRASTQALQRYVPQWGSVRQTLGWMALVGYILTFTDNASRFNINLFDVSDAIDDVRRGGDGAPGALGWLVFWVVGAVAYLGMTIATRFYLRGGSILLVGAVVTGAPGMYTAVFVAVTVTIYVAVITLLVAGVVRIFNR